MSAHCIIANQQANHGLFTMQLIAVDNHDGLEEKPLLSLFCYNMNLPGSID